MVFIVVLQFQQARDFQHFLATMDLINYSDGQRELTKAERVAVRSRLINHDAINDDFILRGLEFQKQYCLDYFPVGSLRTECLDIIYERFNLWADQVHESSKTSLGLIKGEIDFLTKPSQIVEPEPVDSNN